MSIIQVSLLNAGLHGLYLLLIDLANTCYLIYSHQIECRLLIAKVWGLKHSTTIHQLRARTAKCENLTRNSQKTWKKSTKKNRDAE